MKCILVLDSNTDYHLLVKRKLSTSKYSLIFAKDLHEARSRLEICSFDLIIISDIMKNSSGDLVMSKLREFGYTGPILVTTSGTCPKDNYEYLSATAVVDKCTNKEDFIKIVKSIMTPNSDLEEIKEISF